MKLTNLQKQMIFEIIKLKSEYPEQPMISLRLTTLLKRFGYTNSIINSLMKKKIMKEAIDLEKKELIKINVKSSDVYNPGEEYIGEAYNIVKKNVEKIKDQLIKPNYLFNRSIGVILNVLITVGIILLFYLISYLLSKNFDSLSKKIDNFLSSDTVNKKVETISNLLFIFGVPFTVVSYFTKNRNKNIT